MWRTENDVEITENELASEPRQVQEFGSQFCSVAPAGLVHTECSYHVFHVCQSQSKGIAVCIESSPLSKMVLGFVSLETQKNKIQFGTQVPLSQGALVAQTRGHNDFLSGRGRPPWGPVNKPCLEFALKPRTPARGCSVNCFAPTGICAPHVHEMQQSYSRSNVGR